MPNNIQLNRNVYNKNSYSKVIDTEFKELGVKTVQEQIDEQPSVQEFFNLYNELFFQINEFGPESHEFLVKTSGEYINFQAENDIVKLLQAEIAGLREQLLEAQKQTAEIANSIPEAPEIPIPEIADIPEPEPVPNPVVETITQPQPVVTEKTLDEKVIDDFSTYPKSKKKKRADRLDTTKAVIKRVKKENNL